MARVRLVWFIAATGSATVGLAIPGCGDKSPAALWPEPPPPPLAHPIAVEPSPVQRSSTEASGGSDGSGGTTMVAVPPGREPATDATTGG